MEAKPLFRPDVLHPLLSEFSLPERATAARPRLEHWAALIDSGRVDGFKEKELLPDFLTDLFGHVLGYTGPAGGTESYTLSREQHIAVEGEFADAVLGRFHSRQRDFIAVLEGKGPKDPLDRPHGGRRLSAVEQAYRYAINLPCDWILVTNIRQIRLYHKGSDQQTFELFEPARLAAEPAHLKKWVYLLGVERVAPAAGECHFRSLLAASERAEKEITRSFYNQYARLREDLFHQLVAANPTRTPGSLLSATQKLLDRILFIAFSEDRGLLPPAMLKQAYEHADPFNPRPVWDNFRGLFRSIHQGNPRLRIPAYDGGLFEEDAELDTLAVPDAVCAHFRLLGEYDFRTAAAVAESDSPSARRLVDVDVLGHIFEQSITDLERLRDRLQSGGTAEAPAAAPAASRRRREGAFYTPKFITRYIVGRSLGAVLEERLEALRKAHATDTQGRAGDALADPRVYDPEKLPKSQRDALVRFWEAWQGELESLKILDPACGSGAFLIEAFDQLLGQYRLCNARLAELRGPKLYDPDRAILERNLYGVDLNEEAVDICRLSLWIQTAQAGKPLTSLDHTVRCGNSLMADPDAHPRALDWAAAFPEVYAAGGFDVVIGNPPYVRQELLGPLKSYLQAHYASYHGMADLYVYFYELGLRLLRPGGRLSYVVTNKWLKAGYAEPLRALFGQSAWMESVVDFGHAKQIFEDSDVFPCVVVARQPDDAPPPEQTRVCVIPREQLRVHDLAAQIDAEGFLVPRRSLGAPAWELEPPEVAALMEKIRRAGIPLVDYAGVKPLYGIKTGFNEAFLIDTPTRDRLVREDPGCAGIIKPYLRGQDLKRWSPDWAGMWMILLKSSENHPWFWAEQTEEAESCFRRSFPALHAHFKLFEPQLRRRLDRGRHWWELRSCAYYDIFDNPKILYQEIQFHPNFCLDDSGTSSNNKTFLLPTHDSYLLGVLNSPLMWWHNFRYLPHMKDEALSPVGFKMENLPIAAPVESLQAPVRDLAGQLVQWTVTQQQAVVTLLDWLRIEMGVDKPAASLRQPWFLGPDAFVAAVKKSRGKGNPLTPAALQRLRKAYEELVAPAWVRAEQIECHEHRLDERINAAYGLTPEEVDLMWRTAPPRMPAADDRLATCRSPGPPGN